MERCERRRVGKRDKGRKGRETGRKKGRDGENQTGKKTIGEGVQRKVGGRKNTEREEREREKES